MAPSPAELTLKLTPEARIDVIDVARYLQDRDQDFFARFDRAVYCSHHTTAGYLEQSLCSRLRHDRDTLQDFVGAFQKLFPPDADYRHDQMHLRHELSAEQRQTEPRNGDSHLTYIGSGLKNCVSYVNRANTPVYLIELDGICGSTRRERHTTVIGFNHEEVVAKLQFQVPVSDHSIDSVNIKDPRLGLFEQLDRALDEYEIEKGRVDISLEPHERHAGLTVNEYETLLMQHDLAEVLRNPLRFVAEKGKNMVVDPLAIPNKTINYAKYDFVQILNKVMDALGLSNSPLERVVDKFMAVPAARFLRMKRSVSMLVSDAPQGSGRIVQGTYQSPILVQWAKPLAQTRVLDVTLSRFR